MGSVTMSIDWEDLGQMYGKYHYGKITEPVRGTIERQTKIILDLLDETGNKATFFVLGALAQYRPEMVKEIAARGHEIALHSQNHEQMFTLNYEEAREDVATSQKIITDIIGQRVYGYRAPFFSINRDNLYLLEILAELDLIYDSSIFPMALPRYGIKDFSTADTLYSLPNGKEIVELPMTTGTFMNKQWPVCGGGYMRIMPAFLINRIYRNIASHQKDSIVYMHPYEFDSKPINVSSNYPEGAKYSKLRLAAINFRWNIFRPGIIGKLRSLLNEHHFITAREKAEHIKNTTTAVPLI